MEKVRVGKNRYGKVVVLPVYNATSLENDVEDILRGLCIDYRKQYVFKPSGFRHIIFDFAIMWNDKPVLFIKCDSRSHYDPELLYSYENNPEKNRVNVTKQLLSDAVETKLSSERKIPILRICENHKKCLTELIMSYISVFVDDNSSKSRENQIQEMFYRYGISLGNTEEENTLTDTNYTK